MPAKIRLQRHGKKASAFFHIVIADGRAPRDGRFIEKIGTYNPNTNPASIDISFDRALYWLQVGAQPTDTCRAILSYKGVLYKNHLLKGVAKGALTPEIADARFDKWQADKTSKIDGKKQSIQGKAEENNRARLKAEAEVKEAKARKIAEKLAAAAATPEAETAETTQPEASTEAE